MFLYLNPFAWGMRPSREYYSEKTQQLITDLNTKYHLDMNIKVESIDTLWYFRDVKHHRISELKHFELYLQENKTDTIKIRKYVQEFNDKFEHRMYFDSVKVNSKDNSVIYKTKINE